jgi:hypothetical protein
MADFTPTQGRYLAFIHAFTNLHGYPPSESEVAAAMCVSPPSVNQMVKALEKRGLIQREPGQPRTIRVLVPEPDIPLWNNRKQPKSPPRPPPGSWVRVGPPPTLANLYVLSVFLTGGPIGEKFASKEVSRVIEIRGDQTLDQLHEAIFAAYDRWDAHMYEFQLGKRPFDPKGPNYGIAGPGPKEMQTGDARKTKLDDLDLKVGRVFGYWFDFGDDWFHQIEVRKIEKGISTVTYPRITKRVGKSPPQYCDE